MKIKFLLFGMLFTSFFMSAQFTVVDGDGNEINDGDVIGVNSIDEADATINFFVTNEGSGTINSTIEYVSRDTEQTFQLCYGEQCYDDIQVGSSYPPIEAPQVIEPGETTGQGNHFLYTGEELSSASNHVFRFYTIDNDGNEVGDDLTFTYTYDSNLSIEDAEASLGLNLGSTIVNNNLYLNSKESLDLNIYDLQGRLVQSQKVEAGNQELNVANLSTQLYIFRFSNDQGVSKSFKIVKK